MLMCDAFIWQATTVSWNESVYTMFYIWYQLLSPEFIFVSLLSIFVLQKILTMDFVHICSEQTHVSSFFNEIAENLRVFFLSHWINHTQIS
jgi:hypothetical protein